MVGATVLGVFLQSLPPDRRVAMARVASLIRRAARVKANASVWCSMN